MKICFLITLSLVNTFIVLSSPLPDPPTRAPLLQLTHHQTNQTVKGLKETSEAPELLCIDDIRDNIARDKLLRLYIDEKRQLAAHKKIVRLYIEDVWNQGNMNAVDELVAESYAACGSDGQPIDQHRCIKTGIMAFRSAFPDGRFTISDMIAESDKVVTVQSFQGTHLGEFNGMPATENRVSWTGIFIYRIQDGKIAERWSEIDTLKFMMQIGAISPGS